MQPSKLEFRDSGSPVHNHTARQARGSEWLQARHTRLRTLALPAMSWEVCLTLQSLVWETRVVITHDLTPTPCLYASYRFQPPWPPCFSEMSAHVCHGNILPLGSSGASPVTSSETLPTIVAKKTKTTRSHHLFHPPPPPPFCSILNAHHQLA